MSWEVAMSVPRASPAARVAASGMDGEEFQAFYTWTARQLRSYLSRLSGDAALSDDLLQEAYVRFLGAQLPHMDDAGRKRYLFRIATNLLRDHFRRSRGAPEPLQETPVGERMGEEVDLRTDMAQVFQRLKPREREILWLAYVEGSSHKEIAEILGLQAPSIRLLLFRARRKLARLLRQRGFGPEEAMKVNL